MQAGVPRHRGNDRSTIAGLLLLVGFVLYERVAREPMMHLELFGNRTFAVTNLYTLFLYAALGGSLFFVPFNLLNVQGYTPTAAGAALLPFILIMFTLSRFSGGLVARVGVRAPLVVGAFIAGLGFVAYAMTGVGHSYWVSFFPAAVILGFGGAAFVAPLTTAVMGAVSEQHAGIASGINNAIARTAGLIAIAVLGIALATTFESRLGRSLGASIASPATLASVARNRASIVTGRVPDDITDSAQRELVHKQIAVAYADGFRSVMLISAALAWLAGLMAWFFLPPMARTKPTTRQRVSRARSVTALPSRGGRPRERAKGARHGVADRLYARAGMCMARIGISFRGRTASGMQPIVCASGRRRGRDCRQVGLRSFSTRRRVCTALLGWLSR